MSFISDRLGLKRQESNSQPSLSQDIRGNEFSRRNNPDLYNARLRVKQDIPNGLRGLLENSSNYVSNVKLPIPTNLLNEYLILLTSQQAQESQLAALSDADKARTTANLKCAFIKMQMREFESDAYNPYLADLETQREGHLVFMNSRNGKDEYNEGKTQETYAVESRMRQEYTEKQVQQKKGGILGFLRGGN
jgi:hypothetical protein